MLGGFLDTLALDMVNFNFKDWQHLVYKHKTAFWGTPTVNQTDLNPCILSVCHIPKNALRF